MSSEMSSKLKVPELQFNNPAHSLHTPQWYNHWFNQCSTGYSTTQVKPAVCEAVKSLYFDKTLNRVTPVDLSSK